MNDVAQASERRLEVAIIGAGISGLYCAMKCSGGSEIGVFEGSNYVGGRISSHRYEQKHQLEFVAEFGPMRIEPEQQELLAQLLEELGIRDEDQGGRGAVASLTNFPAYSSPPSLKEPSFLLSGDVEVQADLTGLISTGVRSHSRPANGDCGGVLKRARSSPKIYHGRSTRIDLGRRHASDELEGAFCNR